MSSPGILRQYLDDYTRKAQAYYRDWREYDDTIPKDENGDPLLYYVDRYKKNHSKRTYYHQMYKNEDGSWQASSHGSKHSPGSLVAVPEQSKVYIRQDRVPQYDKQGNIIGYVFIENPGEFDVPAPSFTKAQEKKILLPSQGRGIASAVRSSEGIIGRFLGREEETE